MEEEVVLRVDEFRGSLWWHRCHSSEKRRHGEEQRCLSVALNEISMEATALDVCRDESAPGLLVGNAGPGVCQEWDRAELGAARSIWSAHFRAEHQTVLRGGQRPRATQAGPGRFVNKPKPGFGMIVRKLSDRSGED